MRIAILSDLQGNLAALQAVLADIEREHIDQTICLGDVALTGPQPHETIQQVESLNCQVVMGNCDEWLLDPQPYEANDERRKMTKDINYWCLKQLLPSDFNYLRSFEPTISVPLGNRDSILCYHGSPKCNMDSILPTTSEEDLERILDGYRACVMAGGHTHVQMFRRYDDAIIVNPGSVGSPDECNWKTNEHRAPPWAEYALLDWSDGRLGVDLRRVPIDTKALKEIALSSGMPNAEWWAAQWK